MNSLVDSILNMKMDVYAQQDVQDPDTGAIKKTWLYTRTVPCYAKGIISNSTSRTSDKQSMGNSYVNQQIIEIRTESKLNIREKITNVRDSKDVVIWSELNYPTETPTVFELIGTTPITDPFGGVLGYNSSAKRSENQVIGL
jgi:hypothetical protein